jgi:hypothetical protein
MYARQKAATMTQSFRSRFLVLALAWAPLFGATPPGCPDGLFAVRYALAAPGPLYEQPDALSPRLSWIFQWETSQVVECKKLQDAFWVRLSLGTTENAGAWLSMPAVPKSLGPLPSLAGLFKASAEKIGPKTIVRFDKQSQPLAGANPILVFWISDGRQPKATPLGKLSLSFPETLPFPEDLDPGGGKILIKASGYVSSRLQVDKPSSRSITVQAEGPMRVSNLVQNSDASTRIRITCPDPVSINTLVSQKLIVDPADKLPKSCDQTTELALQYDWQRAKKGPKLKLPIQASLHYSTPSGQSDRADFEVIAEPSNALQDVAQYYWQQYWIVLPIGVVLAVMLLARRWIRPRLRWLIGFIHANLQAMIPRGKTLKVELGEYSLSRLMEGVDQGVQSAIQRFSDRAGAEKIRQLEAETASLRKVDGKLDLISRFVQNAEKTLQNLDQRLPDRSAIEKARQSDAELVSLRRSVQEITEGKANLQSAYDAVLSQLQSARSDSSVVTAQGLRIEELEKEILKAQVLKDSFVFVADNACEDLSSLYREIEGVIRSLTDLKGSLDALASGALASAAAVWYLQSFFSVQIPLEAAVAYMTYVSAIRESGFTAFPRLVGKAGAGTTISGASCAGLIRELFYSNCVKGRLDPVLRGLERFRLLDRWTRLTQDESQRHQSLWVGIERQRGVLLRSLVNIGIEPLELRFGEPVERGLNRYIECNRYLPTDFIYPVWPEAVGLSDSLVLDVSEWAYLKRDRELWGGKKAQLVLARGNSS